MSIHTPIKTIRYIERKCRVPGARNAYVTQAINSTVRIGEISSAVLHNAVWKQNQKTYAKLFIVEKYEGHMSNLVVSMFLLLAWHCWEF